VNHIPLILFDVHILVRPDYARQVKINSTLPMRRLTSTSSGCTLGYGVPAAAQHRTTKFKTRQETIYNFCFANFQSLSISFYLSAAPRLLLATVCCCLVCRRGYYRHAPFWPLFWFCNFFVFLQLCQNSELQMARELAREAGELLLCAGASAGVVRASAGAGAVC
jgi:hypothetical protein